MSIHVVGQKSNHDIQSHTLSKYQPHNVCVVWLNYETHYDSVLPSRKFGCKCKFVIQSVLKNYMFVTHYKKVNNSNGNTLQR